jgi:hypothetical protein
MKALARLHRLDLPARVVAGARVATLPTTPLGTAADS